VRIPFWPKRRPATLVVTFTQEIDLKAVAAGAPLAAKGMKLVITCSCGGRMHSNAPSLVTTPISVTQPYACDSCGDKVDVVYAFDAMQPEAV
jgi:hypothetical protein